MSNIAFLRQNIQLSEIYFPTRFAKFEERPYGVLFYMDDNRDSYDGNHAFIFPEKITDLGMVLEEITAFYRTYGIHPSIYHPFCRDYFKNNLHTLTFHNYTYTPEEDHRVMLLCDENRISVQNRLEIKILHEWDQAVAEDILLPAGEPWEIEVTKRRIQHPNAYLFVGYLNGHAVVYTDIHCEDSGVTRFDYIVTSPQYRGQGYASELLRFVVEYCKNHGLENCWQWAGPSEHICYLAGFREIFTMEAGYATHRP